MKNNVKKTDLQKFESFKKRHRLSTQEIVKIVLEYANSDTDLARTFFTEKYDISVHTFYSLRDYSIITGLVTMQTYYKLKKKAAYNYSIHNEKNSALKSEQKFKELLKRRNQYIDSNFSTSDIEDIGLQYSQGISRQIIGEKYQICTEVVSQLLFKGLYDLIYSPEIILAIKARIISSGKDDSLVDFTIKPKLVILIENIKSEISLISFQLENYDFYFRGDEDLAIPSKEFLNARLSYLLKKFKMYTALTAL